MKLKLIAIATAFALTFCSGQTFAAQLNDKQCLTYMVYRESRGEQPFGMRAVLDVAYNRMRLRSLTACQVLMEKGQFPYARHGVKLVKDRKFLTQFSKVCKMMSVLDEEYIYFNTVKHKFGRQHKKIGKHWFSK